MRQLFSCIILIVVFSSCNSQTLNKIDPDFNLLNQYFKKNNYVKDSLAFPLIHQNDNYSIQFASQSLNLNKNEIQLSNPYSGGRFPLAFSLLFDGHLITLFDNGKFACHNLTNFKRNLQFEELLNRRKFDYAWIIDGSIVAKYNYEFFQFDRNNLWTEYKNAVPFCKKDLPFDCKPKLFEDNQYLVYQKCEGEFGGAVFFYNKQTGKTYQTQTSCSNSIIKKGNKYQVLSHLGHMSGSSDLQVINNLDDLKETPHVPKLFDYWGIQTFASFLFRN